MTIPNIEELKGSQLSQNYIRKHYAEFYEMLVDRYKDTDLSFSEMLYFYFNNMTERPRCVVCGATIKIRNAKDGYATTCSKKCSNKNPEKIEKSKQIFIERFGSTTPAGNKEIRQKMKDTCKERYGAENPLQCKEIKERVFTTIKERYGGIGNASDELRKKFEDTCIEKYGTTNILELPEMRDKIKRTNLERRGVEYTWQSEEVQQKKRDTMLERYGTEIPLQCEDIKEKTRQTNLERYGVEWFVQSKQYRDALRCDSRPNRAFAKLLDDANIFYEREFALEHYNYDFRVGDILIEIDPVPTHNSTWGIKTRKPMEKDYHKCKSECARRNGYHCIHVFDWDSPEKVIGMLLQKDRIFARKCTIVELTKKDADAFLEAYHLQGKCTGNRINLALTYNGTVVQLMTFGTPRYNKNYEYELLRFCTKAGYMVVGGAERLFGAFVDKICPASVVSYCDRAKFSGDVYQKLGFSICRASGPTRHWCDRYAEVHITDNLLRQHGFDKLFNASYGKGTSNVELMRQHGFVEVYDCGQDTWEWKENNTNDRT